jgi:hypothetical protein
MAALALAFSIVVLSTCDFVIVDLPSNSTTNLTTLTFGQYRYNPDGEGCRSLSSANIDVSWDFITGQVGLFLATSTSSFLVCSLLFCFACAFCRHSLACPFLVISLCYSDRYPLISPILLLQILLQSMHYDNSISPCHCRHDNDIFYFFKYGLVRT